METVTEEVTEVMALALWRRLLTPAKELGCQYGDLLHHA